MILPCTLVVTKPRTGGEVGEGYTVHQVEITWGRQTNGGPRENPEKGGGSYGRWRKGGEMEGRERGRGKESTVGQVNNSIETVTVESFKG